MTCYPTQPAGNACISGGPCAATLVKRRGKCVADAGADTNFTSAGYVIANSMALSGHQMVTAGGMMTQRYVYLSELSHAMESALWYCPAFRRTSILS
jgi:hypothetical protein